MNTGGECPSMTAIEQTGFDPSQQAAVELMQSGASVFLTGQAGTGKSFTLLSFLADRAADVTASTGVAALSLRNNLMARSGMELQVHTLHSWAGIGLGPGPDESSEACFQRLSRDMNGPRAGAFARVRKAATLVIDEISMLNGSTLNYLEYHCRQLRDNRSPWGGLQVIMVGDFLQLPPVTKSGSYDWAFNSRAWQESALRPVKLSTIHRQADPEFIGLLNAVRIGRLAEAESKLLRSRVVPAFPKSHWCRLLTHNLAVDKHNNTMLDMIEGEEMEFLMEQCGHCGSLVKSLLTPDLLTLKRGARVMVTVNLKDAGGGMLAVNGTTGIVQDMTRDWIAIKTDNGGFLRIERYTWYVDPQKRHLGHVRQFPLKLAWACTIHKAQGLSMHEAYIDIQAAREPGQAYTALSRVRSLEGLHLKGMPKGIVTSREAVRFMESIN